MARRCTPPCWPNCGRPPDTSCVSSTCSRTSTRWSWRGGLVWGEPAFQAVRELVQAMQMLEAGKFKKAVAFVYSPAGQKVRTNNHVERANRRLRFWEKLRYKWRRRKWVLRFVLLALDRCWRAAAAQAEQAADAEPQKKPSPFRAAG